MGSGLTFPLLANHGLCQVSLPVGIYVSTGTLPASVCSLSQSLIFILLFKELNACVSGSSSSPGIQDKLRILRVIEELSPGEHEPWSSSQQLYLS